MGSRHLVSLHPHSPLHACSPPLPPLSPSVVLEEKPHPVFTRQDNDLIATPSLTLLEALTHTGLTREITLLDGTTKSIAVPPSPVQAGQETRVPDCGMPVSKKGALKKRGDLILRWKVEMPKTLSQAKKDALKQVLA